MSAVKLNLGYKLLSNKDVLLFGWERKYINICCCFCYIISYSAFSSFHLSRYSAPVGETPAGASTGRGPRHWASFPISTWQTSPAQDRTLWVHLLFYSYVWEPKYGVLNKPHTWAPTRLIFSEFFSVLNSILLAGFLSHLGKWVKLDLIWGYIISWPAMLKIHKIPHLHPNFTMCNCAYHWIGFILRYSFL